MDAIDKMSFLKNLIRLPKGWLTKSKAPDMLSEQAQKALLDPNVIKVIADFNCGGAQQTISQIKKRTLRVHPKGEQYKFLYDQWHYGKISYEEFQKQTKGLMK